jgi:ketosteroid isomerase-like protein
VSEEDLELVRQTFDAMHRGEHQEAVRGFHADAVWQNTATFPGPRCCLGPQAIVDFSTSMFEDFDGTQEIERLVADQNAVLIGVHSVGRTTSGVPVDFRWAAVVQLRDGQISRVDIHGDWSNALKAVGLEE